MAERAGEHYGEARRLADAPVVSVSRFSVSLMEALCLFSPHFDVMGHGRNLRAAQS